MGIVGSTREDLEGAVEGRLTQLVAARDVGQPACVSGIVVV